MIKNFSEQLKMELKLRKKSKNPKQKSQSLKPTVIL